MADVNTKPQVIAPVPSSPSDTGIAPDLIRPVSTEDDSKTRLAGHVDYHGIDTTQVQPGTDAAYEAKIVILNEALIDIGMGPFQWKIFATTGFGWFIDNVSTYSSLSLASSR